MKKVGLGFTQIFWGNGKGKSTSAFGTALRACGNNFKVHMIQFMKNGVGDPEIDYPGEIKALQNFPNFTFKRFGTDGWVINEPTENQIIAATEALNYVKECLHNENYDIIIADEILYAIQLRLLTENQILELIENKPKNKEFILTGSHKPFPKIFDKANLVTEIKKYKHPYDSGFLARRGLEY